ncbi:MAG TPA: lipid II flippase MurJ, partial [Solirubrobacterales bacterium]|nr:lipid II flippase MurJ [Solirubrobacterales bacterium]
YQLPQGIFSVAIATVLFPTLARFASAGEFDDLRTTMANGMRQILFVLIPAAAAILVLSEPMIRLVYERGAFDAAETEVVATALFWFALSLPANGLFLLLTRTFFSLQRPWIPTWIAAGNLLLTAGAAWALYDLGVGGIVASTAIATVASVIAQGVILRRLLDGLEIGRLISATIRITIAAAGLALISWIVWDVLDELLGRGLLGQIASLSVGLAAGLAVYLSVAKLLRVAELEQMSRLLPGRRGR